MKINLILLAGGNGTRMQSEINKVLLDIHGKSCIRRSAEAFIGQIARMIVVCRKEDKAQIIRDLSDPPFPFPVEYTDGGITRQDSVFNGLSMLQDHPEECVLIHDAARCLVDRFTIKNVIRSVLTNGNGIASVPMKDTVKLINSINNTVFETPDRSSLRIVQTPQGFLVGQLLHYEQLARQDGFIGTDDASVLEHYKQTVFLAEGNEKNIKLTTPEDLVFMRNIISGSPSRPHIGYGYDVHQLTENRKLILCGVEIPYSKGLLGHSDADVAVHALIDSLLGACALGDIGQLFPDSSEEYKDISSLLLLEKVVTLLNDIQCYPVNADITISAQKPKLAPYIEQMRKNIADTLHISVVCVSVKATTTERLGFVGREEGIEASAVCLVDKKE